MNQLHFLFIFIFLSMFLLVHSLTHPRDKQALQDLKSRFESGRVIPGSCLESWDFNVDPCDHLFSDHFTCGLRCDLTIDGLRRVTEIGLDSVGYSGSLSSITWDFPHLHTLDLSGNSLSGSIPDSISRLTHLTRLSLSKNSFSSDIPTSIGSIPFLEELFLDNNQLTGSIPLSFNKLEHLKKLQVQQNRLFGEFPYLGTLKNLSFFDASDNGFTSISTNPFSVPLSLISFSMRNNNLEGEFPRNFLHMENLEVLDLSYNHLKGKITGEIFQHPSLQQLSLSHNRFSAIVAPKASGIVQNRMVAVDLSYNEIYGVLPKFFAALPNLSALSLEHNMFTGVIPKGYATRVKVGSFQRLLLGGNYLLGPIPGPLKRVRPGSANVSLKDNCLHTCPDKFFFCQGGNQKTQLECKRLKPFGP